MHILQLNAAEHKIQSLTVFRAGSAEVVRSFDLSLKRGDYEIDIIGLANLITPHSVRASGLGAHARLVDLVRTLRDDAKSEESDTMRELLVRQKTLKTEKQIREQEVELYLAYGRTLSDRTVPPVEIVSFLQTFVDVRKGILDAVNILDEQLHAIEKAIADEKEKQSTAELASGRVKLSVIVEKECSVKLKLTYMVLAASWDPIYDLHASIAEDGKSSSRVMLHYRARITQSTGEDWKNATLTLSTATQSQNNIEIPKLCTYRLKYKPTNFPPFNQSSIHTFGQPQAQAHTSLFRAFGQPAQQSPFGQPAYPSALGQPVLERAFSPSVPQSTSSGDPEPVRLRRSPEAPSPVLISINNAAEQGETRGLSADSGATTSSTFGRSVPLAQQRSQAPASTFASVSRNDFAASRSDDPSVPNDGTIISSSPLSTSYTVEGAFNVPSDGAAHNVSISVFDLSAEVTRVCVPRIDAVVLLQCRVQNTSEYLLLSGPVSIFLNDSFVTRTVLREVAPKDYFECALGKDLSMRIRYKRTRVTEVPVNRNMFGVNLNTSVYTAKTIIENRNSFAVSNLVVQDGLPISSEDTIKVELKKPDGLAETRGDSLVKVDEAVKVRWSKETDGKGGESEGKYDWLVTVGTGETVTLQAEWEIKTPGATPCEEVADIS